MFKTITTLLLMGACFAGCATAPSSDTERRILDNEVDNAILVFKEHDPGLETYFRDARGYAVFPSVGKGALGVGGAYGQGELFDGGERVGFCDLTQGTIGFQVGGQSFHEVIFFETAESLERFKAGTLAFTAQVSAVAVRSGASLTARYEGGVAVFTIARGGLMYEAAVGGQSFDYEPR